ncbi:MAG TPA: DUF1854 domain-containing protein [Pirellulales bacterium]|jgi:hypothetical protein|nr:DUF1854 domain-containing protein [Pirellulales bacterium]
MMASDPRTNGRPEMRSFGLQHDAWGRLVLIDAEGQRHVGVEPVRAFPISDPQHWISIVDAEGRELVCIDDVAVLPAATLKTLEEELARREFVPVIERIERISTGSDPSEWHVRTDRGATRFLVKSEEDIRRLGPERVLIIDDHGVRYSIPDFRALDPASKRLLERYL